MRARDRAVARGAKEGVVNDQLPEKCPFCDSVVPVLADGKPCRADDGAWVAFKCLTSMHKGQDLRMCQSRPCEEAERQRLTTEVDTLRSANAGLMKEARQLSDLRERAEERARRLEAAGDERPAMSDTTQLQERLASMVHAFEDEGRKYAVRLLASDVGKVEAKANEADTLRVENVNLRRTIESLREAGQDAIDYIDGKHRDAGRVLDGWRKANQ